MYHNSNIEFFSTLRDYHIKTADDKVLGKIRDIYFDDVHWMARYFVVDTRKWLPGKKVLISPVALNGIDRKEQVVKVSLNEQHVKEAPSTDMAKPVSRQLEDALHAYYGWPRYWVPTSISPTAMYPYRTPTSEIPAPVAATLENRLKKEDSHLRSADEICGYHIDGLSDRIGSVEDIILDIQNGHLLHLVVNAGSWFRSRMRIVPTVLVSNINWADRVMSILMPAEIVENSAEFDKPEDIRNWKDSEILGHYFNNETAFRGEQAYQRG